MMLSGEPVTSEYALQIGLVNEVVAADRLEARAHEFAALLAGRSAPAMAEIKRLVSRGIEKTLEDAVRMERAALPPLLGSADYAERSDGSRCGKCGVRVCRSRGWTYPL